MQIVELAVCTGLIRLDISKNQLTSLDGVAMNTSLRWLSAAGNALTSADALKDLEHLEVLNLGRNQLEGKVAMGRLRALKALIANDNQITLVGGECPWGKLQQLCVQLRHTLAALPVMVDVPRLLIFAHPACLRCLPAGLDKCKELNTLVLSHNAIASLGSWVATCAKLEKLSLSHNQLAELGAALK